MQVPQSPDLGAAPDGCGEHAFEVVVAVGCLLAGERAGDGVGEQEDPHLLAFALGERVREAQPVVGAFRPVGGVVEDDECLHLASNVPVALSGPHPGSPASRRCGNPAALDLQVFK